LPDLGRLRARDRKIVVIAYGSREGGEAVFIARTYSDDVTLLTLGQPLELVWGRLSQELIHQFLFSSALSSS
jgi:hypothetical protein